METRIDSFTIRVLVYPEEGEIAARALEMDLLGFGSTPEEAVQQLSELIECQISFARVQKDESLILFPAEKEYFERWEKANFAAIKNIALPDKAGKLKYLAVSLTIPKRQAIAGNRMRFKPEKHLAGT